MGRAGDRVATVLVYLHTPDEGGETYFPDAKLGMRLVFADCLFVLF
jgi:hypothetical protein